MSRVNRRSAALATLAGNGLTVTITVAQAFLLIPLCLAYLGPNLYGSWLAAAEVLIWVQMLDGGLPNLLMQRVGALAGRSEWAAAARWTSTILAALCVIGLSLLALASSLAPAVGDWVAVGAADRSTFVACFRTAALASVLLMLGNGCVGLSRGVQRTALINVTQVCGAVTGLVVSMALLVAGWGLWALAIGLLARAVVAIAGAVVFLARLPPAGTSWWASPSSATAGEVGRLMPYMSTASIGYVLATNSEVLLVTTFLGPLPALAYALTRRAFDGVRTLLDTIAWAVSGGFAHLVTADDRSRSRAVLREILWVRLGVASVGVGIIVAVNAAFVSLLFGPDNFGGIVLTLAFALHIMLSGQSFLANYLWRASGYVREGSLMLGAEAGVRVVAMALGLLVWGLPGAPVAAAVVSGIALVVVHRRLDRTLPAGEAGRVKAPAVWTPAVVLTLATAVALAPTPLTWWTVGTTVVVIGALGGGLLWLSVRTGAGLTLLRQGSRGGDR